LGKTFWFTDLLSTVGVLVGNKEKVKVILGTLTTESLMLATESPPIREEPTLIIFGESKWDQFP